MLRYKLRHQHQNKKESYPMNEIIHEIITKITQENIENMDTMLTDHKNISRFILETKKMLDEVGTILVKSALETTDELTRNSAWRKKSWHVQRRNEEKTLLTIFGEINYQRTYYKHKIDKSYSYLSDEALGIEVHDRMDMSLKSELVEKAIDLSYKKSGESASENVEVTNQSVMNCIREIGAIDNNEIKPVGEKKTVEILYIEADEDHVAMQDGSNKEMKLVYVHEGRKKVSKNRYKLINPRYFTGLYNKSEELWVEVAEYIDEAYTIENTRKVYLSGDGARWIKEGLNWIKDSIYVLDRFHLSKYIKKATGHMPYLESTMWRYINNHQKQHVKDLFKEIILETDKATKQEAVKEAKRYIMNNWEGIERQYDKDYIGCSAQGHVSHILADRLSSRPLGWSNVGADQMARLRVFKANGGNVYKLVEKVNEKRKTQERVMKLDKRVIKNRLSRQVAEKIDNITILNTGKRTWANEFLKSIRGA